MELAETRDRLRKREDEVRDLKISLNDQIAHVDSEYRM
jgi:chromosome segregation ATPase